MSIKRTNSAVAKKRTASAASSVKYEVKEDIGTISIDNDWELKLRLISWNDNEPKWDIRRWKDTEDGEKSGKGLTLTEDELFDLRDFLNNNLED